MEEGDNKKTRVRASSDSENTEGKKKKNKITKGVFTRSHSDIQGRPNVTHKEKDKDEDRGSGTYIARPKNGKKEKHVEDEGHHKRAQSHGLNSSKEDKKKKKSESAKEIKSPPEKEKKFKEKLESFLQMKKKKPKDSAQTEIPDNPKRKKKLKRKKPNEVTHKKRTKEKAKSDSEGGSTKKWRPTESFRMRLETEFAELEEEERRKKTKRNAEFHPALEYHNLSKNRYNNVLPNPETRVKLRETDGEGDYINANFVQGERETYIACQAPLPNTFADFWRMVYEQKVYVIMMLTRLKERDRVKAEQYWPSVGPLGRTRVFVPLRREKMKVVPEEGDTDGGEDELTTMLNHASRSHDTEDGEKEKEKQKSKKKKKPVLRDNFYGPGTNGDEEQSQSSGEEADSFEEKLSKDSTLSFETDWGRDDNLEDEDDEGGFTEYGPISVRLQKTLQPSKKFTIRHFYIKHADHKGEIRRVVQIHYTGWPDFGTPKSTRTFHKLLTLMEKYKKESPSESTGPIVLHCSAGLGRTGTLIAAHIALEKLRLGRVTKSDEVDMKSIVAELRDQRHGMVQTKEQYLFLNELVREYSSMSMYV